MNSTNTVTFNVGGKLFEVGRPLLEKYHETMMLRVLSEMKVDEETTDPIFIDRDSTRFGYVLDYMRDGKVTLPITISKDCFVSDLNYFGIGQKILNGTIVNECNVKGFSIGLHAHFQTLQDLNERTRYLTMCLNSRKTAYVCVQSMSNLTMASYRCNHSIPLSDEALQDISQIKEIFNEYDLRIYSMDRHFVNVSWVAKETEINSKKRHYDNVSGVAKETEKNEKAYVMVDGKNQKKQDGVENNLQAILPRVKTHDEAMKDLTKQIGDQSFYKECRQLAFKYIAAKISSYDTKKHDEPVIPYEIRFEILNNPISKERIIELKEIFSEYGLTVAIQNTNFTINMEKWHKNSFDP
jgi:BTB/POZ domain